MSKKLIGVMVLVLLGGSVFAVMRMRRKSVKAPDAAATGAKVTKQTAVDLRGPDDSKPRKVDHVEMAVPDVPV